jgi:dihydropteroate synthase
MAVLNSTPDSFYAGSRFMDEDAVLRTAGNMLADGADILDIGGQSSRPGAEEVGVEEELKRLIHLVDALHRRFPDAILSVDTWFAEVARRAVEAGASIINDISGGLRDTGMLPAVASLGAPFICMHMKGSPATMNREAFYENLLLEVLDYFVNRLEACRQAGIHDVILDPGLGFAKTHDHNLLLLQRLEIFKITVKPILIGISRKSTIYKTLGITPAEALNGSTVLHTIALLHGASILRVHDPKEARETIRLMEACLESLA